MGHGHNVFPVKYGGTSFLKKALHGRYGTSFSRKIYGRSFSQGTNDQIMPRGGEGSQIHFPVI